MTSITFLPGTLLAAQSFSDVNARLGAYGNRLSTEILGERTAWDDELSRLADTSLSPQVWIGHSLGGIAAINLAVLHPDVCRAIVCISSTARADAPSNREKRIAQLQRAQAAGSCEPISLELKPVFGLQPGGVLARSLAEQANAVGLRRFANQTEYALTRLDQRRGRGTITCPVLAIVGADDDICAPELSDEIVALSAHTHTTQTVRIQGAGHLAPMTHSDVIATSIVAFLNRVLVN
jgi:pimeloyl-ACP methyl ester carboxylesterase